MNAELLLFKHYDKLIDSPDAVWKLRWLILDLAVRGRLVEQDPDDEPAIELLHRIKNEKLRLIEAGTIKRQIDYSDTMEHIRAPIPDSWEWTALGDVFLYDAGRKRGPKDLDRNFWLLELEDIEKDSGRLLKRVRVSDREAKSTKSEFQTKDILYGKLRPYLNKVLVADQCGYSTTEIVSIRPFLPLCSEYCALALRRQDFVSYVTRLGQGTKMPRLRTEDAKVAAFPLPPLAEQHRIATKVDKLLEQCGNLEEMFREREVDRKRFSKASFASLTAPVMNSEKSSMLGRFVFKNFDWLTIDIEQVETLRQTIINLAVRGRLVKQNSNDESAEQYLERIPTNEMTVVGKDEFGKPFEIPSAWKFIRFGLIHRLVRGVVYSSSDISESLTKGHLPILRANNIEGELTNTNPVYVRKERVSTEQILRKDDFLIALSSGSKNLVGKSVYVSDDRIEAFGGFCGVIRLVDPALVGIVRVYLRSSLFREGISESSRGIGINNLKKSSLENILFPLPPLEEQIRIVNKVDELMNQCDLLEDTLRKAQCSRNRLLEALKARLLSPKGDVI